MDKADAPSPYSVTCLRYLQYCSLIAAHLADDIVNIQNHLHHADLLVIDSGIEFCLDLRLAYVINRESQLRLLSTDLRKWGRRW